MKKFIFLLFILFSLLQYSFSQSTPDGLERKRFYDIQHILIKVSFDEKNKIVYGECTTTLQPLNNNFTEYELDAINLNIKSVRLSNGKELKYEAKEKILKIFLDKPYSKTDKIVFTVIYQCSPKSGLYFIQPDSINPKRPWQIWTQGQGRGNDNWFPCYNYFNDKTTTETIVTVKENYTVLSNGKLISVKYDQLNKTKTFHWKESRPHATYLVMLAIGEYSIIKDRYENLPVLYYVYKGQQEDAKRCFRLTPDMIKFFSKKIGFPFPYEKYAQVCIADFMFGGMENTSATTLNDKRAVYGKRAEIDYQNTNLVAHELAHQWWGGLVNQRDGVSHWLQEGFATYFDALYQEYRYGKDEFMRVMDNNMQSYKNAESRQGKIPMVSKTTPFVYVKGASVLNMLRFILGESDFFKSIRLFAKRFAYGNAFTDDFIKVVNDVTGKDLNWFFDEWLFKAGYPTFEVKYNYNELKKLLDINVKQIHKTDSIVPIFRTPIDIEITTANEKILKRVEIEKQEHTFQFKLDSKPLNIIFDKGNWIVKDLRFDKTKEELLYQFKNAKDAYDRKAALVQLKKIIDEDDVFNAFCEAALKEPDWTVRIEAIDSVVVFSRKEGIDLLLKALNDPKSDVRIASINNLRYIRGEVVSDALIKVIKNDSSYYAVSYALMALAIIDSIKAFDVIAPFAKMDSFRDLLKLGAITAFEIINTAKAIPYLIELSKSNESFNIRERAISALAAIRGNNERTIEFLKTLFIDPNEKIRLRVFQTIAIIGTKNIVPVLEEREKLEMNLEVKEQIKKSISEIDK